jgi:adenine deaminase
MSRHNAASNVHDLRGIGKHNVSNLIYVPLIAPNTSVYPTAIVSSNHEPINQSYTVSTEAVCNSRKNTLCSSPCTISSNVNSMSKSTSDKLPSKALKTIKQPRKVLKIAHINICNLRNKVHEVNNLLVTDDIHILTISETHLDNTFDDTVVAI